MSAKLPAAALALLLFASPGSQAALMSARDLLTACGGDVRGRTICDGYLMGLTDMVLQRESRGHAGKICVPETVTIDQVRDAVLNVGQRPRLMNAPSGVMLVRVAMRRTWPCAGAPDRAFPDGTSPDRPLPREAPPRE